MDKSSEKNLESNKIVTSLNIDKDPIKKSNNIYNKEDLNIKNGKENIENNLKNLVDKLEDCVVIISADHGAVNVDEIYISEIPEINDCLKMQ